MNYSVANSWNCQTINDLSGHVGTVSLKPVLKNTTIKKI